MQEVTEKTQAPLTDKNEIRPYDKVKIKWILDKHLTAGTEEEVHPVFAEKMVATGKAEYADPSKNKKK
jgi:hypothetical protein